MGVIGSGLHALVRRLSLGLAIGNEASGSQSDQGLTHHAINRQDKQFWPWVFFSSAAASLLGHGEASIAEYNTHACRMLQIYTTTAIVLLRSIRDINIGRSYILVTDQLSLVWA